MAPERNVDKGKASMVEEDRSTGPITRSRTTGIVIGEARREQSRQRAPVQTSIVEEENAQIPVVEQGNEQAEQRAYDRGEGPSGTAVSSVEEMMSNPAMTGFMHMMMGMMQEMRHDIRQEMRQLFDARSHPRSSSNPTTPRRQGAQTDGQQTNGHDDDDVRVIGQRIVSVEERQIFKDDRADMKAFQTMNPPAYNGEMDYKIADKWIRKMEKIFAYLKCTDEQMVRYATFMLEEDADAWWNSERENLPDEGIGLTWVRFLDLFLQRYVPMSERVKRAAEFSSLVQDKMTVAEYDMQFRSLSRFVAWTKTDLVERARKFKEGLKHSIRSKLAVFNSEEYAEILDRAQRIEREEVEWGKTQDRKREADQGRRGGFQGRRQRPRMDQQLAHEQQGRLLPECAICGKRHMGECRIGTNYCFGCGEEGHRRWQCLNTNVTCFNCGQKGHRRDRCPQLQVGGFRPGGAQPARQQQPLVRALNLGCGGHKGRPQQQQQYQPLPRIDQRSQVAAVVQAATTEEVRVVDGVVTDGRTNDGAQQGVGTQIGIRRDPDPSCGL